MENLRKLCSIDGVSGNECEVSEMIKEQISKYCDAVYSDSMGNLIAEIDNGCEKTVLIEAHTDQIGLVVKSIDKDGFIKFTKSGGINPSILPTAEVVVHGKEKVYGVIGAKPPHLQTDSDKRLSEAENMYIDCGFSAKELENKVSVGDTISFISEYVNLQNGCVASKSLDNRIGVYIAEECLKHLYGQKIPYNIKALFSVQEEVGCRGAIHAIEEIAPEFAVVIDVTFGISPYTNEENGFKSGGGITLAVGPNLDRRATEAFMDACKKQSIPFDKEVCGSNPGTDSWPIQVSGAGVKCVLVSVPIKYMHTTVETVDMADIKAAADAITFALKGGAFGA